MTTTATTPRMTARDLMERLHRHYIKPGEALPGGVFLPEVTMTTAGGRRADALYIGFTSSRGHHLHGHEVKVTRADWLHELDDVSKAEVWASQCHAWWIVAPSTDIVRAEELPHGWGLLVPSTRSKTRMDVAARAELHRDRIPSWDAMHSVTKRMDTLRANAISEGRAAAEEKAREGLPALVEAQVAARVRDAGGADELRARLRRIEEALGGRIVEGERSYVYEDEVHLRSLAEVGALVRAHQGVAAAAHRLTGRYADNELRYLRTCLDTIDEAMAAVRAVAGSEKP